MSVLKITKDNFQETVLDAKKPVIVDFWAAWCGPCKMVGPVVEEIATSQTDILIGKINIDEEPELAAKFGVMSIPTFIAFKEGQESNKAMGVISKEQILALAK